MVLYFHVTFDDLMAIGGFGLLSYLGVGGKV
jgi:hypothetical protein